MNSLLHNDDMRPRRNIRKDKKTFCDAEFPSIHKKNNRLSKRMKTRKMIENQWRKEYDI